MMKKSVKIHMLKEGYLEQGYRVIAGYKGFGAVGIITVLHIVNQLGMEKIGLITTKYHPEYVFRDESGLSYPYEIYASKQHKLVAIVTRELPDEKIRNDYVEEITRFIKKHRLQPVYLIGGLDANFKTNDTDRLRWMSNAYYKEHVLQEPLFEKGLMIVGPLALQLMYTEIMRIPALVILPYARAETPDPAAAAIAVEKLNELLDIKVSTKELFEEAAKIQEELRKLEEMASQERSRTTREPYM